MTNVRIHDLFENCLVGNPDRVFLHVCGQADVPATLTYSEVGVMVDALQTELIAAGVRPGDRVMVVAENCPEHVALIVACSRIGAW